MKQTIVGDGECKKSVRKNIWKRARKKDKGLQRNAWFWNPLWNNLHPSTTVNHTLTVRRMKENVVFGFFSGCAMASERELARVYRLWNITLFFLQKMRGKAGKEEEEEEEKKEGRIYFGTFQSSNSKKNQFLQVEQKKVRSRNDDFMEWKRGEEEDGKIHKRHHRNGEEKWILDLLRMNMKCRRLYCSYNC